MWCVCVSWPFHALDTCNINLLMVCKTVADWTPHLTTSFFSQWFHQILTPGSRPLLVNC
jgi:hypothetical protein